jgi:hypothetical protein
VITKGFLFCLVLLGKLAALLFQDSRNGCNNVSIASEIETWYSADSSPLQEKLHFRSPKL